MIKIRNYTNEDIEYIKNNYNKLTIKQLVQVLNKSESSIYNAIRKLGLKKQIHKSWSDSENLFLKKNYLNMSNSELAEALNRSFNSISAQLDRLNLIRAKSWTKEEEKYLQDNFKEFTYKEIGVFLGRTEQAIRAKCFDLNLYKQDIPWSEFELNYIRKNYREIDNRELSKILNRTENAIHLQASRMGLKKYPYHCDYHYFNKIDTEEKAYWLGFLAADGWINKNEKTNSAVVGIELQYGDINHLRKFNKSIGGNYQITDRWKSCNISTMDKEKKNHTCVIRIFSTTMYNSLNSLGFMNDKSYSIKLPDLSHDLICHYIRGYFDGNGCLTVTNKTFKISFITASEDLKNGLVNIIRNLNINIADYSYINKCGTTMYRPDIARISDKIKFLDYIYKDSTIYLDRKYKKYLKAKKKYNTTQSLAT